MQRECFWFGGMSPHRDVKHGTRGALSEHAENRLETVGLFFFLHILPPELSEIQIIQEVNGSMYKRSQAASPRSGSFEQWSAALNPHR